MHFALLALESFWKLRNSSWRTCGSCFTNTLLQRQGHSGPYRSRADENKSNDVLQQESHDRPIYENIPGSSRKRKCVNQINQSSQDTVTLRSSGSDSYLSKDSACQRKYSENPLSKYSKVDSDVEVEGDQDNSYKVLHATVKEDFGPPIDTKLADILERIWGKAKLGDYRWNSHFRWRNSKTLKETGFWRSS